jgi:Bacterial self-protective colicin-like immunity
METRSRNTTVPKLNQQRSFEMSLYLLELAEKFIEHNLSSEEFVEKFTMQWREERDSGSTLLDDDNLSEKLSTIFCFSDLYNPDDDREDYEYDEYRLRTEIKNLM